MSEDKMVKEADLIAFKKAAKDREAKLAEQVATLTAQLGETQSQLKVATVDVDDDEDVKKVRKGLLEREKAINEQVAKWEKDRADFAKREKSVRAKEISLDLKGKGVDIKEDALLDDEDMDKKAHELYVAHLAEENAKLKKEKEEGSPGSVYETGTGGGNKKDVWSMPDKEFDAHLKSLRQEALAKK